MHATPTSGHCHYLETKHQNMKFFLVTFCLAIASSISSQTSLEPFDRVNAFGNVRVILTKGESPSFNATKKSDDLNIRIKEGTLKISHKHNDRMWSNPLIVEVTYTVLDEVNASAGANVEHDGVFEYGDIELSADAGAKVRFDMDASSVRAFVGEGGVITLDGICKHLEVKGSTGAIFEGRDLKAESVTARSNTGAELLVYAVESVDATAMMGGHVMISGDPPRVQINESLGGTVSQ